MGQAAAPEKQKVVHQINDPNSFVVNYALGLVDRHINLVGGTENIDIKVISHGPSLQLFQGKYTESQLMKNIGRIIEKGADLRIVPGDHEEVFKKHGYVCIWYDSDLPH